MKLLIDLDIILYRGLWATKDQGYYAGVRACDSIVNSILDRVDHTDYELILSGQNNFRKQISPEYKANRKPESKPQYLYDTKKYFEKFWKATAAEGEADDLIGIKHDSCTTIISSDKDFFSVGGKIYNPFKDESYNITNPEYHFYYQLIVGDSADNVKTLHGYGPKKAEKILADKSKDEMREAVQNLYREYYGDEWYVRYDTTARLLFIQRGKFREYFECM
jgi:5'-3' exonuclease